MQSTPVKGHAMPTHPRHRLLMTADPIGGVELALTLAQALQPFGIEIVLATMGAPLQASQRAGPSYKSPCSKARLNLSGCTMGRSVRALELDKQVQPHGAFKWLCMQTCPCPVLIVIPVSCWYAA